SQGPSEGNALAYAPPAVTTVRGQPLLEQFYAFRRLWPSLGFTNDGSQVYFSSNASGQFNLWCVPTEGGCPGQLTALEEETGGCWRWRSGSAPIRRSTSSTSRRARPRS